MARKLDVNEQLIRHKIEKLLAWLTLVFTLIGVAEKSNHYIKMAQKKQMKKKHPLGFRP